MRKIKKYGLSMILVGVMLLNSFTYSKAYSVPNSINEQLIYATNLLEDILKDGYQMKLDEIRDKVVKSDGFDYQLTMEALAEKPNIFKDADYLSIIAAYLTVSNNINICDIDFYDIDYEESYIEEAAPYKYYSYVKNNDGTYSRGAVHYLLKDGDVEEYKEVKQGVYEYVGIKHIELPKRNVSYYDPTITLIDAEALLEKYGSGIQREHDEYESRKELLKASGVSTRGLKESIMLMLYSAIELDERQQNAVAEALSNEDENRSNLVKTAVSLLGKVPYQWGGKASKEGYDEKWWTFGETGEQLGLDCSGFVQWAYRTAGYGGYRWLASTETILNFTQDIDYADLQPGDIGLLNDGSTVNHTGIYIGDNLWIHCSSSANTVIIAEFPFTIYKRVPSWGEFNLYANEVTITPSIATGYSEADIMMLSQLVSHEALGEGLNGWVGVVEVVLNRIASAEFPNTMREVIYQPHQFSYVEDIASIEPSENIVSCVRSVLDGQMKVLNDPSILFFRNPGMKGMEDWGGLEAVTSINNHVFYRKKENLYTNTTSVPEEENLEDF